MKKTRGEGCGFFYACATGDWRLATGDWRLAIADCRLPIADRQPPTANRQPPTADWRLHGVRAFVAARFERRFASGGCATQPVRAADEA
ncbi:hypothetical protein [Burkholderia savannae]|uniref:hypothetical protein n=1 Tax=Burkholderia savannae TaxID=1637837 RepID=UPI000AC80841|nr:hypothetical protein [Burkholderia savannae]